MSPPCCACMHHKLHPMCLSYRKLGSVNKESFHFCALALPMVGFFFPFCRLVNVYIYSIYNINSVAVGDDNFASWAPGNAPASTEAAICTDSWWNMHKYVVPKCARRRTFWLYVPTTPRHYHTIICSQNQYVVRDLRICGANIKIHDLRRLIN